MPELDKDSVAPSSLCGYSSVKECVKYEHFRFDLAVFLHTKKPRIYETRKRVPHGEIRVSGVRWHGPN